MARTTGRRNLKVVPEDLGEIEEINEFERVRKVAHDVEIHEEKIVRERTRGRDQEFWQPVGKTVPVLLILNPVTFKAEHEQVLRSEPNFDREHRHERVIRGALKRHDEAGEIFFEMGRSDEEADEVIKYAIDLLKGYGIRAKRDRRFTAYLSRSEW